MKTKRKLGENNIRKITKMGGGASYGITIPIEMMRVLSWKERQKVVVKMERKKLIIKDWKE